LNRKNDILKFKIDQDECNICKKLKLDYWAHNVVDVEYLERIKQEKNMLFKSIHFMKRKLLKEKGIEPVQ
jgi:hypothetical protein